MKTSNFQLTSGPAVPAFEVWSETAEILSANQVNGLRVSRRQVVQTVA